MSLDPCSPTSGEALCCWSVGHADADQYQHQYEPVTHWRALHMKTQHFPAHTHDGESGAIGEHRLNLYLRPTGREPFCGHRGGDKANG